MSDDDPEQEQETEQRETSVDREEREHRRMNDDSDKVGDASGGGTGVDDIPSRPNQPVEHDEESGDEAVVGKNEEQMDVPQIMVDRPSRLDTVKQVEEISTDDEPVAVPQIQFNSTALLDADEMEETVLIEGNTGNVAIPQFTTNTPNRLTPMEFANNQLEGIERVQQVQIPRIIVDHPHRIEPFETFLETVPEVTAKAPETQVQATTEEPAEDQEAAKGIEPSETAAGALDELRPGDDWITGEWPDPLELLFGSGGTDIKSDNPVVVLVDDDELVGVVETVVKRLYREKEGGEPDLQKFNTAGQLADEEQWMSADSRMFTAELPDEEWETLENEDEYQDEWRSIWKNRFDQLFSGQQFGAIIFNRSRIPGPEVVSLPHHPPRLVELTTGVPWKDVADVFWSSGVEDARRAMTFSQLFDRDANGVAQDRWVQILQTADGKFDFATDDDESASDDHYAMKVFVVKWLAEQLWENDQEFEEYDDLTEIEDYREIERTILTEHPVSVADDDTVKPDVMYGAQVFEVEMFFEEADESGITGKLQQSVRKYEDVEKRIETINIVVDNLTCLLHLKDLARFKRNHRAWEEDHADIALYTVDLSQEELVPVNGIIEKIANLG